MKTIFFELLVHLGFLLCHIGCRLSGEQQITTISKNKIQKTYYEGDPGETFFISRDV